MKLFSFRAKPNSVYRIALIGYWIIRRFIIVFVGATIVHTLWQFAGLPFWLSMCNAVIIASIVDIINFDKEDKRGGN